MAKAPDGGSDVLLLARQAPWQRARSKAQASTTSLVPELPCTSLKPCKKSEADNGSKDNLVPLQPGDQSSRALVFDVLSLRQRRSISRRSPAKFLTSAGSGCVLPKPRTNQDSTNPDMTPTDFPFLSSPGIDSRKGLQIAISPSEARILPLPCS